LSYGKDDEVVGRSEGMSTTAAMAKRIKELEEKLRNGSAEATAPSSSHRHASSTRSGRGDGRSNRPTGTDQYIDQVVDSEAFLTAAFRQGIGRSFLPK
jgi:hypothetical protein